MTNGKVGYCYGRVLETIDVDFQFEIPKDEEEHQQPSTVCWKC